MQKKYSMLSNASEMGGYVMKACPSIQQASHVKYSKIGTTFIILLKFS